MSLENKTKFRRWTPKLELKVILNKNIKFNLD